MGGRKAGDEIEREWEWERSQHMVCDGCDVKEKERAGKGKGRDCYE